MIIDTHLHVWSDDIARYPFADGRTSIEDGSVELLNKPWLKREWIRRLLFNR